MRRRSIQINMRNMLTSVLGIHSLVFFSLWSSQAEDVKSSNPADNQTITVMTCNVRTPQPVDSTSGDGWEDRRKFCIETIKNEHPDIIGFQECSKPQFDDLRAAFSDFNTYGANAESPDS